MSDNKHLGCNDAGHHEALRNEPAAQQRSFFVERLSAGLLAAAFSALGWLTLWQGGMAVKGKSGFVTFVDGRPGRLVAALCFCAAAMGLLLLLRSLKPGRLVNLIALLVLMVPPLLYGMARH
jgi:hypothetical protein